VVQTGTNEVQTDYIIFFYF